MKRVTVGLAVAGAIVLASQAGAFVRSNSPAIGDKAGNTTKTTSLAEILRSRQMSELSAKGLYAGIDDNTPTPRIFWADRSNPKRFRASGDRQAQALSYLKHYADALQLSGKDLSGATFRDDVVIGQSAGGAQVVSYEQRIGGLQVHGSRLGVVVDHNGELVAIAGGFFAKARSSSDYAFKLDAASAASLAIAKHFGTTATSIGEIGAAREEGEYRTYAHAKPTRAAPISSDIRTKQLLFPVSERLFPAYYIEFYATNPETGSDELTALYASGLDGAVLHRQNLTQYESFKYRVWAEDRKGNTPTDGPTADFTPHPTGKPEAVYPDELAPILVELESFNHNADGGSDPWLSASANTSKGNNVDAYSDRDQKTDPNTGASQNDGFTPGDLRAETTATRTFDRVFDTGKSPDISDDQIMAAVTQLFYTNNWLHDYWYDSGFNEKAGNAQSDNYGRGGSQGDPIRAEAQDSALDGQRNNANMSTPADGASPRMQMYLWTNSDLERSLTPSPKPTGYEGRTGVSLFGPADFDLTADAILASDGTAPETDGCENPTNDLTGKIIVVEAGFKPGETAVCKSVARAKIAQAAGAKGLVFIGNGDVAPSLGNDPAAGVTIPGIGLAKADGDLLVAALKKGDKISLTMKRKTRFELDGTIDNQIVAHEHGHYFHHRLVNCSATSCASMSEGWGDYLALHMTLREEDPEGAVYGIAGYATASLTDYNYYYGIRRYPYSTDFNINPLTFKHIMSSATLPDGPPSNNPGGDNAEVHNAGEVWAMAMYSANAELTKDSRGADARFSYEQAQRRVADYIVAGMKATPTEPSFVEQRDAILAAAKANDELDHDALARGFARRGFGSCAKAPNPSSTDNAGTVEAFGLSGRMVISDISLDDSVDSCNNDGILDAAEKGKLKIRIFNSGSGDLTGTQAKVTVDGKLLDLAQTTVDVPTIKSMQGYDLEIDAEIGSDVDGLANVEIEVEMTSDDSCEDTVTGKLVARLNGDTVKASSTSDDVEAPSTTWTVESTTGDDAWSREALVALDQSEHVWLGKNGAIAGDNSLISPTLKVGSDDVKLSFDHAFSFDQDTEPSSGDARMWDGGVIEVSTDDGKTWKDASEYASVDYNGEIGDLEASDNPLKGRAGFVGNSGSDFPKLSSVTIDFADKLANKDVKLRFRIGNDSNVGGIGWLVDNIAVEGIDNLPFHKFGDHDPECIADDTGSDTGSNTGSDDSTGSNTNSTATGSDITSDAGTGSNVDSSDVGTGSASTGSGDKSGSDSSASDGGGDQPSQGCGCNQTPPVGLLGLLTGLGIVAMPRRRRNKKS